MNREKLAKMLVEAGFALAMSQHTKNNIKKVNEKIKGITLNLEKFKNVLIIDNVLDTEFLQFLKEEPDVEVLKKLEKSKILNKNWIKKNITKENALPKYMVPVMKIRREFGFK